MAKYLYPAIFTPEEDGGFYVRFPDIPNCFTGADTLPEALDMAKDVLCLTIYDMEQTGKDIPSASTVHQIQALTKPDEFASLIDCDTVAYRKTIDNRAVKKTLSIPAWLNTRAEEAGINFSQTLQAALKKALNVDQ